MAIGLNTQASLGMVLRSAMDPIILGLGVGFPVVIAAPDSRGGP